MNIINKDTVIVTEAGNIIAKAGDLIDSVDVGTEVYIHKMDGTIEKNKTKILTPKKMIIVDNHRVEPVYVDMDQILPRDVLQRRKKLIRERMDQERIR